MNNVAGGRQIRIRRPKRLALRFRATATSTSALNQDLHPCDKTYLKVGSLPHSGHIPERPYPLDIIDVQSEVQLKHPVEAEARSGIRALDCRANPHPAACPFEPIHTAAHRKRQRVRRRDRASLRNSRMKDHVDPLLRRPTGRTLLLLAAILLVGSVLRLWGIGFGLPYEYHVDEVQYVRQAVSMGAEGLKPVWWNNPPFYKYVLLAEYATLFGAGKLAGWYESAADFGVQKRLDPTPLYLLGRGTTALLGTATVLVVYWLGSTAYNERVGLLAGWFLTVCFLHVRDSHYAVNDVPVTFFVTVALTAAVMMLRSGDRGWYALAGAALGLGFATKYSAALAVVPMTVAHALSPALEIEDPPHPRVRRFVLTLGTALLAAVLVSPYFVLTPGEVIHDAYEALYLAARHGFDNWQIDPAGGYLFYLRSLMTGLGWGLLLLCLGGLAVALLRRRREDVVLVSLPLTMYALMGRQRIYFTRFILPMVPALLVLGASLWETAASNLFQSRQYAIVGFVVGALLLTGQPLVCSVRHNTLLTRTDTRTLAKQWIEANVPAGSKIALDWPVHGPPLATADRPGPRVGPHYDVTLAGGAGLSDHPLGWYHDQGFDYLVASSFIYQIPLVDEARDAKRRAFYSSLPEQLHLVQVLRPRHDDKEPRFVFDEIYGPLISLWQRERPGPTIKIYALAGD